MATQSLEFDGEDCDVCGANRWRALIEIGMPLPADSGHVVAHMTLRAVTCLGCTSTQWAVHMHDEGPGLA